jgi:hypothetical protein
MTADDFDWQDFKLYLTTFAVAREVTAWPDGHHDAQVTVFN